MKKFIICICAIFALFLISGCSKSSLTKAILQDAQLQIKTIQQDIAKLPLICSPESFNARLDVLNSSLQTAYKSWDDEISRYKADANRWRIYFWLLAALAGAAVLFKLKSKLF